MIFPEKITSVCEDIINRKGPIKPTDTYEFGNTDLHRYIIKNRREVVKSIIEFYKENANDPDIKEAINHQNDFGDTPIHLFVKYFPDDPLVLDFIDAGAKFNIKNKLGEYVAFEEQVLSGGDTLPFPSWLSIEELTETPINPNNELLNPF
jgi:ankyrin repeat protein